MESDEDEESARVKAPCKPVERLQKKAHMNIIFIGHVGKIHTCLKF